MYSVKYFVITLVILTINWRIKMTLNLTILPLWPSALKEKLVDCNDKLTFTSDYRVFGQLMNLSIEGEDIPKKPTIKTEFLPPKMCITLGGMDNAVRGGDSFDGKRLTFVLAGNMKGLKMPADSKPKNLAIMAYVNALPEDTPIILYWN
jgi:hypothetical protein